nr:MAG TPA: hypothetical protein [Caudoviricetes sp.]
MNFCALLYVLGWLHIACGHPFLFVNQLITK